MYIYMGVYIYTYDDIHLYNYIQCEVSSWWLLRICICYVSTSGAPITLYLATDDFSRVGSLVIVHKKLSRGLTFQNLISLSIPQLSEFYSSIHQQPNQPYNDKELSSELTCGDSMNWKLLPVSSAQWLCEYLSRVHTFIVFATNYIFMYICMGTSIGHELVR